MKFTELLKSNEKDNTKIDQYIPKHEDTETISEEKKKPEEILRGAGFKIKLVTPTSFGTQFDLAKLYDEEEIKKLLDNFNIKIKGKSIFIID